MGQVKTKDYGKQCNSRGMIGVRNTLREETFKRWIAIRRGQRQMEQGQRNHVLPRMIIDSSKCIQTLLAVSQNKQRQCPYAVPLLHHSNSFHKIFPGVVMTRTEKKPTRVRKVGLKWTRACYNLLPFKPSVSFCVNNPPTATSTNQTTCRQFRCYKQTRLPLGKSLRPIDKQWGQWSN